MSNEPEVPESRASNHAERNALRHLGRQSLGSNPRCRSSMAASGEEEGTRANRILSATSSIENVPIASGSLIKQRRPGRIAGEVYFER